MNHIFLDIMKHRVEQSVNGAQAGETEMSGRNQHVVPHRDGWAVRGAGSQRATSVHGTQRQAIEGARDIAARQSSELLIHGQNGRIRERNSYGRDPYPPEG